MRHIKRFLIGVGAFVAFLGIGFIFCLAADGLEQLGVLDEVKGCFLIFVGIVILYVIGAALSESFKG